VILDLICSLTLSLSLSATSHIRVFIPLKDALGIITSSMSSSSYSTSRPSLPRWCELPFIIHRWHILRSFGLAPCRNLCERVAVRAHNGSLYDLGLKYCPKCAIFFRSDEKNHCFCCGKRLRIRTRNSRTRNRNRCSMCNRRLVSFRRHNNEDQSSICLTCAGP